MMNIKNKMIGFGLAALLTLSGCGAADALLGGSKGGTVTTLWADVPALDGATQSDIAMPLAAKLILQGMIKASAQSEGAKLDSFDFIAFTTSKTPEEVQNFYTIEKMTAAGWNGKDQPGCTGGKSDAGLGGAICIFAKGDGPDKGGAALFMMIGQDEKTKQTNIFYVRVEGKAK